MTWNSQLFNTDKTSDIGLQTRPKDQIDDEPD